MSDAPIATSDDAFVRTTPHAVARSLDAQSVHLWWLRRARGSGRTALKAVLGAYLDAPSAEVQLVDGAHGRPRLAQPHALDFNWSHSGGYAMVAVARGLPLLGVDIEQVRPRRRALDLAQRFFSADEYAALARLPEAQRDEAFLRLWTAKEAVLKAHGHGLSYGLERVTFALDGRSVRAQRFEGEVGSAARWRCLTLAPTPCFLGMLAWRGEGRQVRCFRLHEPAGAAPPRQ